MGEDYGDGLRRLKPLLVVFLVPASITLAGGWFATSPPRPTWFSTETVTVTKTVVVLPWWMKALDVGIIAFMILFFIVALPYMPRRF